MIAIVPSMIVEICLRYRKEIFFRVKRITEKQNIILPAGLNRFSD